MGAGNRGMWLTGRAGVCVLEKGPGQSGARVYTVPSLALIYTVLSTRAVAGISQMPLARLLITALTCQACCEALVEG